MPAAGPSDPLVHLRRQFAAPPAECRPGFVWRWAGRLTRPQAAQRVQELARQGWGGFVVEPGPDVEPRYVSADHLDLLETVAQEAAQVGLRMWLAQGASWPRAGAGPLPGEYTAQVVALEPRPSGHGLKPVRPTSVAAAALLADGTWRALPVEQGSVQAPAGTRELLFCEARDCAGKLDTLSAEAVRALIEVTVARCVERLGPYLGTTVVGVMLSGPELRILGGGEPLPWSPGLAGAFLTRQGYELAPHLPGLLLPPGEAWEPTDCDLAAVRCAYWDTVTVLQQGAYWRPWRDWCEWCGLVCLALTADSAAPRQDHHRAAEAAHLAGVAVEVPPYPDALAAVDAVVSAGSVANQGEPAIEASRAKAAVVLAARGAEVVPAHVRTAIDGSFARGASRLFMREPLEMLAGVGAETVPDTPEAGDESRIGFPHVAEYVGRLSAACSAGEPGAAVALYQPDEAAWCDPEGEHGSRARQTRGSAEGLVRLLASVMVPCDVIGYDALCRARIQEEALVAGSAAYDLVIVPQTEVLLIGAAAKLLAFREAGGRLVFLGDRAPAIVERDRARPLGDSFAGLLAGAYDVDLPKRIDQLGGAFGWPRMDARMNLMDGAAPAYFASTAWLTRFAGSALLPGAVLTVPLHGLGPFAMLMYGMYGQTPARMQAEPETVRCLVRHLPDGAAVTFAVNEGSDPAWVSLGIVSGVPLVVERWWPTTGDGEQLLVHQYPSEAPHVRVRLAPQESALLVCRPIPWTGRRD